MGMAMLMTLLFLPQAFRDKNFPVESNQSKWISMLVDFFVDALVLSSTATQTVEEAKTKKT